MIVESRKLARSDLWTLEAYAEQRADFRTRVLEHKRHRQVPLGEPILLVFEDQMTVKYQIQEMLRIEKLFEPVAVQEELDTYNPLIPDGDNFKCTMLIQYTDLEERKARLAQLTGIETRVWLQIGEGKQIFAIADEDLERSNDEKTSAVHFLRFQPGPDALRRVQAGASMTFGIDHPQYACAARPLPEASRAALVADLS